MVDILGLRDAVRARLARGDVQEAWALMPQLSVVLGGEMELALTWLEAARAAPIFTASALLQSVEKIDAAFEGDAAVAISACATLVATVSRRPIDAPRAGDPLAERALQIAERLALGPLAPELRPFALIQKANAIRLSSRARDGEALAAFEAASAARPDDPDFHFDRGLFHKSRGAFGDAYVAFDEARRHGRRDKPLFFNLAVAATALGRGHDAQAAWEALGITVDVNDAGMPIAQGIDPVELRVPTRGSGHGVDPIVPDEALSFEVVSVAALSPCHGVVQTPTLRDAPIDYGDVVLWDGVPVGHREVRGRMIPRFPLLEILRRGDERRLLFVALEQREGDTAALGEALTEGVELFVLDARIESMCPRCAAGDAFVKHAHAPAEEHRIVYGKIIAGPDVNLRELATTLEASLRAGGAVSLAVPALYEALGDAKRAGQEHQAFRGVEQLAIRKGLAGAH